MYLNDQIHYIVGDEHRMKTYDGYVVVEKLLITPTALSPTGIPYNDYQIQMNGKVVETDQGKYIIKYMIANAGKLKIGYVLTPTCVIMEDGTVISSEEGIFIDIAMIDDIKILVNNRIISAYVQPENDKIAYKKEIGESDLTRIHQYYNSFRVKHMKIIEYEESYRIVDVYPYTSDKHIEVHNHGKYLKYRLKKKWFMCSPTVDAKHIPLQEIDTDEYTHNPKSARKI